MKAFLTAIPVVMVLAGCRDGGLSAPIPFRLSALMPEDASTRNGAWSRDTSVNDFVSQQDNDQGNASGRAVLDGKKCLRRTTSQADHILFGQNSDLYHGSQNGHVVAVLFDDPPDTKVIFVQGR
ncbi:hypothetical protein ACFOM8_05285 [Paracoccus angustae]|uniref:Lipoprotein n=1 Tax=Paracoccus angustae TaxID=1671480 RepID=A0ABV7U1L6_9RHOB